MLRMEEKIFLQSKCSLGRFLSWVGEHRHLQTPRAMLSECRRGGGGALCSCVYETCPLWAVTNDAYEEIECSGQWKDARDD